MFDIDWLVQKQGLRLTNERLADTSGASSRAKHRGAYFSAVRGSIKDPIAVPGWDEVQEC